jgi:hypothetical protein
MAVEAVMTKAEKAKAIINLARNYELQRREDAKYARAAHAGIEASHEMWARDSSQDPFSHNPYNTSGAEAALKRAEQVESEATEILNFVTDHFLGMLTD